MTKFNKNLMVIALVVPFVLSFTGSISNVHAAGPLPVDLLSITTNNFAVLAKTTITDVPSSSITGNIGVSGGTGFAIKPSCSELTGTNKIYDVDGAYGGGFDSNTSCLMAGPGANKTLVDNAVLDMGTAYGDAAGRTGPNGTNLGAGVSDKDIGGLTFAPGLYKWDNSVLINSDVSLSGGASDVWIFQIAGDLTVDSKGTIPLGIKVLLSGGAKAENIFWQVGGGTGATLGTYSTFNGTILSAKQVILLTGAVLNGRALADSQVVLQKNTINSSPVSLATLHVVKLVVNASHTAIPSDFSIHVKNGGVDVSGSPTVGASSPGTSYSLAAGSYVVSENINSLYTQSFSGTGCDSSGNVSLLAGDDKTCTIVNTDIPIVPSGLIGGSNMVVPLIGILKVPSPLALSSASSSVTYNYTVWNVGGRQALTDVSVVDDKCSPVTLLSGDLNSDNKLDPSESWKYKCTTTLSKTTTNTAIATGHSDDGLNQTAIATAVSTVVVGVPAPLLPNAGGLVAPLINITKVPSRLTPFPYGGGNVMYSYRVTNPGIVAMHDVVVTDDKCSTISKPFGDANNNGLLDPSESWSYACQTRVTISTRNTATVEGKANGFSAIGYAFATVLVATPGLPNTGFPLQDNAMVLNSILFAGVLSLLSISLVVVLKKRVN
ncbi:MAG: ice-binding family protein [Candidatus Paceibacterota bacterium]|jgi:hypothetical protein